MPSAQRIIISLYKVWIVRYDFIHESSNEANTIEKINNMRLEIKNILLFILNIMVPSSRQLSVKDIDLLLISKLK